MARARNEAGLRVLDLARGDPPVVAVHPHRTASTGDAGAEADEDTDTRSEEDTPERLAGESEDDVDERPAASEEEQAELEL